MEEVVLKTDLYDGTMESLEKLVISLNLGVGSYQFDVITKELIIYRDRILRPGDYYQY